MGWEGALHIIVYMHCYPVHHTDGSIRGKIIEDRCGVPYNSLIIERQTICSLLRYSGFTEYTQMWGKNFLPELEKLENFNNWKQKGVVRLAQLYSASVMKTFQEFKG